MLKSIRDESLKAIKDKFGIGSSLIRVFFHYHPTYFHLHIHFTHMKMVNKVSSQVARAILLDDVIDNIEFFSPDKDKGDYYQHKTLQSEIKVGSKLH